MTTPLARFRRLSETLAFRVAFLLAVALLPLGLVSAVQSVTMLNETRGRVEAALTGETLRAVRDEVRLFQSAEGAAAVLAQVVGDIVDDPAACSRLMRSLKDQTPEYTLLAFVGVDATMRCSSTGGVTNFDDSERFLQVITSRTPTITFVPKSRVSGVPVVAITHPVFDRGGTIAGLVSISIAHSALTVTSRPISGVAPAAMITFDSSGAVVSASVPEEEVQNLLPAGITLEALATAQDAAFSTETRAGQRRVFAVVPMVPGLLYALGSWDAESAPTWYMRALPSVALPTLMWLACLLVAFLAVERLVTRHIRSLRRAITGFAGGGRLVGNLDFRAAPVEIRELAESFERMTDTILHDEAELEDTVHQKEVLLREVHHRVKNNLQLIASIMSMQMRQARSPEAKSLMRGLQERVMSLATIHRGLYQTSGLTDIRADELLADIVRQVVKMATGPGRRIEVTTSFGDLRLTPDQAVPLSLLLTESLANAMKYAGSPDGSVPRLGVTLQAEGANSAVMEVTNTIGEIPTAASELDMGTGLGSQLMAAFAQQLGGHLETSRTDTDYTLRLVFEVNPLAEAEARNFEAERAGDATASAPEGDNRQD